MIYLSQLVLDPRSRGVLSDLANPYQLHRTVMSGFADDLTDDERVLFRLEIQRCEPYLSVLVQSRTPPNWDALSAKNYLLRPAAVKTLSLEPQPGQAFQFRLLANPTKRMRGEGEKDGRRIGLVREDDQLAWLMRKGEQHGFRVLAVRTVKIPQPEGVKRESGVIHRIRQQAVRFDGSLQVTDAVSFAGVVADGIGSGKAMGFGLLSLARAS